MRRCTIEAIPPTIASEVWAGSAEVSADCRAALLDQGREQGKHRALALAGLRARAEHLHERDTRSGRVAGERAEQALECQPHTLRPRRGSLELRERVAFYATQQVVRRLHEAVVLVVEVLAERRLLRVRRSTAHGLRSCGHSRAGPRSRSSRRAGACAGPPCGCVMTAICAPAEVSATRLGLRGRSACDETSPYLPAPIVDPMASVCQGEMCIETTVPGLRARGDCCRAWVDRSPCRSLLSVQWRARGALTGRARRPSGSDAALGVEEDDEEFQYHSGAGDLDLAGEATDRDWSIRCVDVVKRLAGIPVLNGLNVAIPDDTITVVLGPSGTGKSVLIKHLIGLMFPDSGDVQVLGNSVSEADDAQAAGVAPQDRRALPGRRPVRLDVGVRQRGRSRCASTPTCPKARSASGCASV